MNFRIIIHLFKTALRRLVWLALPLWVLVAATALPWLRHDAAGTGIPSPYHHAMAAGSVPGSENLDPEQADAGYLLGWATAGGVWSLIAAGAIGVHAVSLSRVTPVRRRERVVAAALALWLLLMAPQTVCAAVNLTLHGFSAAVIGWAALSYTLAGGVMLGCCALLGAWCGSGWRWVAGAGGLVAGVAFCGMVVPQTVGYLPETMRMQLWAPVLGPRLAGSCGAAILLLACGLPLVRGRLGHPARIVLGIGLVLGSALAAARLPVFRPMQPSVSGDGLGGADLAAIRPEFLAGSLRGNYQTKESSAAKEIKEPGLSVSGILVTRGCPDGCYVAWRPEGRARISQGGREVAACETPMRYWESNSFDYSAFRPAIGTVEIDADSFDGYFRPPVFGHSDLEARLAVLKGRGLLFPEDGGVATTVGHNGHVTPFTPPVGLDEREAVTLEANFRGTVYRHERIVDVPLTAEPVTVRDGNVTYQIRRLAGEGKGWFADVVVTHPAHGFGADPQEAYWKASPTEPCQAFLQVPESGLLLPAPVLRGKGGPLLSGAGWHREIRGWEKPWGMADNQVPGFKADGVRFILLKPVVLARLGLRTAAATFSIGDVREKMLDFAQCAQDEDTNGRFRRYLEDQWPHHPDPAACTRQEFARWLRAPAMVAAGNVMQSRRFDMLSLDQFGGREVAAQLAPYASRFSRLMAEAAYLPAMADAIRLGTPEAERGPVLAALDGLPEPAHLIAAIAARGWQEEAKERIIRRLDGEGLPASSLGTVMALEEPATYPTLIQWLLRNPTLANYERVRLLPGIQPALRNALGAELERTEPDAGVARTGGRPEPADSCGLFLLAAKDGDAAAFARVIATLMAWSQDRMSGHTSDGRDALWLLIGDPEFKRFEYSWESYLEKHSAADFRYDALVRRWVLATESSK